jgi:DNA polymerase-1
MQEFCYGEMGLPPQRNRKSGNLSCDDKSLEKLARREPIFRPIYQRISELRSLGVFRSTFVQMRLDHDGRVRCSYNIAGTETFRYSSSEDAFGFGGNLQNIPAGDEGVGLPNVRTLFLPDPGYTIFDCDLDRADAQVVAWEANDEILKAIFHAGEDMHLQNAKDIFGNQNLTKDSKERKLAKAGVHAINYGAKPPTLSRALGITISEAERFYNRWFKLHPAIQDWHDRIESQLAATRCVSNRFGFRRHYFDRIENLLPEALAWVPQSTVAIVIDKGLVNIDTKLRGDVDILLQVHDSLVMQCRTRDFERMKPKIREQLLIPIPYDDPLTIGVGIKASTVSWGDCTDVEWGD